MRSDADLCVFDEPSSALDAAAQNDLFERLTKGIRLPTGKQESTIIFVTHRLSTVKRAHKVAMFENGVSASFELFRSVETDYNFRQFQNSGPTTNSLPKMDLTPRFTGRSCPLTPLKYLANRAYTLFCHHSVHTILCLLDFLGTISLCPASHCAAACNDTLSQLHVDTRFPPVDYSRYSSVFVFTFDTFVSSHIINEVWSTKWTTPSEPRMASTTSWGSLEGLANAIVSAS
jgi:energy-coupling factor transporter ATP-binding protein EcfA2